MPPVDDDLDLLTDEERAGLEEDHGEDDAGGDDDGDQGDGKNNADDAGDDDQGQDDANKGDDQGAQGRDDGQDDEQGEDQGERLPLLKVERVEDAEAKLADIDKREDDLTEKFEDGDMTTGEYRKALRELEKERTGIERAQLEADFATKHNQAQIDARWEANVMSFLEQHPEIDPKKALLWNSFDQAVRAVTAETMKAGKNPGLADLTKAYKQWAEELGIKPQQAQGKQDGKEANQGKDNKAPQKKPQREIPPNLANVPVSDVADTEDGRWAQLDRLMETDPLGFEKAMGKLSSADQEAYLAAR